MAGGAGSRGGRSDRGHRGRRGGRGQITAPPRSPSPPSSPKDFDLGTQFDVAIHLGMPHDRLLLPRRFVTLIGDEPRPPLVMLRANGFRTTRYPVDLQSDHLGQMYLSNGWECFARSHQIEAGNILVFKYDDEGKFGVSVFDHTMCRRCYHSDSDE